jgi:DNA topoisomerase-1
VKTRESNANRNGNAEILSQRVPNLGPEESAVAVRLHYVDDRGPGIHRKRVGRHFTYLVKNGSTVRDQKTLVRIKSLAIPPARE